MIIVENIDVWGFEHAVRGMRNPLQSYCGTCRWCKRKRDGTLICIEVDSEYFSDAVIARNWCERWEQDG